VFRTRILFAGGFVIHASGLDDNGRGILFTGYSGAGKSTQAALWSQFPGVVVMNDDRVAVRVEGDGAAVYGTPWAGEMNSPRNHNAPLSAVFILEQAPENSILRLPNEASAPVLLARSFLPYWDLALMGRALQILDALLDRVPVYLLRCRPEPSVIPLVRSVL
jgi:hypothetical protein